MRKPWDFEEPSCAEVGVEIFFNPDADESSKGARQDYYKEAKKICQGCTHLMECAAWGIENETWGVWGGLTPRERKEMRKRLPIVSVRHGVSR